LNSGLSDRTHSTTLAVGVEARRSSCSGFIPKDREETSFVSILTESEGRIFIMDSLLEALDGVSGLRGSRFCICLSCEESCRSLSLDAEIS